MLNETEMQEIEKRNSQLVCSTHNAFYTKTVSVEDGVPIWCCPECLKQANTPPDTTALLSTVRELQRQVQENEAIRDLAIFLAKAHMEWHNLRGEAMSLSPDECQEFLIMKFPMIQGTRNQFDLEKVGALPHDTKNIRKAVDLLLSAPKETP